AGLSVRQCRSCSPVPLGIARRPLVSPSLFFYKDPAPPEIYPLSLHDALPISGAASRRAHARGRSGDGHLLDPDREGPRVRRLTRSEEHTSELQSLTNLVCRLLLEKKKNQTTPTHPLSEYYPAPLRPPPPHPPT